MNREKSPVIGHMAALTAISVIWIVLTPFIIVIYVKNKIKKLLSN